MKGNERGADLPALIFWVKRRYGLPVLVLSFIVYIILGGRGAPEIVAKQGEIRAAASASFSSSKLLSVREMKQTMRLPCNYVHDGFYITESNECVNQVYQTLMELEDDDIPVVIEVGGHDGITKSISLKSSICLNMNTLLIEASANNYAILKKTRPYDLTVNAALCEEGQEYAYMQYHAANSGQNKVTTDNSKGIQTICTTIDAELDKLRDSLPGEKRNRLKLVFLVLDVEGHEQTAMAGLQRYTPLKAMMEVKYFSKEDKQKSELWFSKHRLVGEKCTGADECYNFHPKLMDSATKYDIFYGARHTHPSQDWETSKNSKAYYFYGE
jgi:hypothetical protein